MYTATSVGIAEHKVLRVYIYINIPSFHRLALPHADSHWLAEHSLDKEMAQFRERSCTVYKELSKLPSVVAAHIFHHAEASGTREVSATWKQANVERGKNIVFSKSYFIRQQDCSVELVASCNYQQGVAARWSLHASMHVYTCIYVCMHRRPPL